MPAKPKNAGRVVLTLNTQVDTAQIPPGRDGVDVLRERLTVEESLREVPINELRNYFAAHGIDIASWSVEVTK